jgi:polyketide synthase 12/myxalamid-type polyketide synthase MxaB
VQAAVLPIDWDEYKRQFRGDVPAWLNEVTRQRRAAARAGAHAPETPTPGAMSLYRRLADIPANQQLEAVEAHITEQVAAVIGLDPGKSLDPQRPLNEIGLDSLMAVELRNRLTASLDLDRGLPATLVFDYPTISAIAHYVLRDVLQVTAAAAETPAAARDEQDVLTAIEGLSDDAVERMLSREV